MDDKPTLERVEALLTLVGDDDERIKLERIKQSLTAGHDPSEADVSSYQDLWDLLGEDVADMAEHDADPDSDEPAADR